MTSSQNVPPEPSPIESSDGMDLLIKSDAVIRKNTRKSRRHSVSVRLMRLVFPVLALIIIAMMMIWHDQSAPLTPQPKEKISPQSVSRNELVNPKFQSQDNRNRPYTITADKAEQNSADMDKVLLTKPVGTMKVGPENSVSVKANSGEYLQKDTELYLQGGVEIENSEGYKINSDQMKINVEQETMTSDNPVEVTGPRGQISATGVDVISKEKKIIFKGPVKMTLNPNPPPSSAPNP